MTTLPEPDSVLLLAAYQIERAPDNAQMQVIRGVVSLALVHLGAGRSRVSGGDDIPVGRLLVLAPSDRSAERGHRDGPAVARSPPGHPAARAGDLGPAGRPLDPSDYRFRSRNDTRSGSSIRRSPHAHANRYRFCRH